MAIRKECDELELHFDQCECDAKAVLKKVN